MRRPAWLWWRIRWPGERRRYYAERAIQEWREWERGRATWSLGAGGMVCPAEYHQALVLARTEALRHIHDHAERRGYRGHVRTERRMAAALGPCRCVTRSGDG